MQPQCTTLKKDARAKVPLACIWAKRWIKDGKLKERVNDAATSVLRHMLPGHHPLATLLSRTFGTFLSTAALLLMVSPTNRVFDLEICLLLMRFILMTPCACCSAAAMRPDTRGAAEVMALAARAHCDGRGAAAAALDGSLRAIEDSFENGEETDMRYIPPPHTHTSLSLPLSSSSLDLSCSLCKGNNTCLFRLQRTLCCHLSACLCVRGRGGVRVHTPPTIAKCCFDANRALTTKIVACLYLLGNDRVQLSRDEVDCNAETPDMVTTTATATATATVYDDEMAATADEMTATIDTIDNKGNDTDAASENYDGIYSAVDFDDGDAGDAGEADGGGRADGRVDGVAPDGTVYECEFDCGFEHESKQFVEVHELSCTSHRAGTVQDPITVQDPTTRYPYSSVIVLGIPVYFPTHWHSFSQQIANSCVRIGAHVVRNLHVPG